jgi:acyl-CoA thioester hydrolase
MNVMWYVGKFDEATWQLFRVLGLTPGYLRDTKRGMAAVDQHISYIREVHAGTTVSVTSRLLEVKERSVRFEHEMFDDETGEVVARTTLKGVHLDKVSRKSCAFDDAIVHGAKSLLSGGVDGAASQNA